jgi:hypothetical protein
VRESIARQISVRPGQPGIPCDHPLLTSVGPGRWPGQNWKGTQFRNLLFLLDVTGSSLEEEDAQIYGFGVLGPEWGRLTKRTLLYVKECKPVILQPLLNPFNWARVRCLGCFIDL